MNTRNIINIVKYVSALTIGVAIAGAARPAVKDFFKLGKKEKPETIPSVDIDEEEVPEDEWV